MGSAYQLIARRHPPLFPSWHADFRHLAQIQHLVDFGCRQKPLTLHQVTRVEWFMKAGNWFKDLFLLN